MHKELFQQPILSLTGAKLIKLWIWLTEAPKQIVLGVGTIDTSKFLKLIFGRNCNAIMRHKNKPLRVVFFLWWTTCCSYCWNCVCLSSQLTFWWFLGCLATSPCYLCIESRCERCMARLEISDKGCEMHRSDFPWLATKVAILLAASCCSRRPFNFQGAFAVRFWKYRQL